MGDCKTAKACAFAIGIVCAASAASAQETTLDPISIFATLSPISAFDYPGQVAVIEREEIETRQASTLADVLRSTPGVFVDGGARRSGQAPTIRGFREEDILILVDGVKQSFISGHDGRIFIDPDLLKTVEIVKGPISSLYGSGALGGVIALTTVDAADFLDEGETAGVRLKAGYQSANDELTLTSTGFARSNDGKFDVIASFTYREGDDIELGEGASFPGGVDVKTLPEKDDIRSSLLKGTAELAPDLKLTGTWVHYQNDSLNPNNPQGGNIGDEVDRNVESDTVSGKLSYAPSGNPLIDGNLLVYWARHKNEEGDLDTIRLTEREIETTGVNIDNRSRFTLSDWAKLTLTYGAEYYIDKQTSNDNAPIGGAFKNVPDADASFYGAFTQAELKFTQPAGLPGELTVIPGIRFDGFENEYKDDAGYDDYEDTAVSTKLGVSYKPIPWLLLFGNYGEAFRAPSYTELYAQGNHFPGGLVFAPGRPPSLAYNRFIANPGLRPQDGVTVEGGLGFDFKDVAVAGDRLTLKGSYWETDASNFIDLDVIATGCSFVPFPPFNPATCFSQYNNKDAELDGVEIELKYDSARLYGGAGYATIDGTDTDTGLFLGSLQPDKVFLEAGVKVPEIWSRFGTRFTFADEMEKVNDPSLRIDSYTLIDVYAVIEPGEGMLKGLRLDLGVDNLTDEDYAISSPTGFEKGINYKAALSWTTKW